MSEKAKQELNTELSKANEQKGVPALTDDQLDEVSGGSGYLSVASRDSEEPLDAASGLPTGKRQHKPVNVGFSTATSSK